MSVEIRRQAELCLQKLRAGILTEKEVSRIIELASAGCKLQDLLYLQTSSASPNSEVIGMRLIKSGVASDGPENPDDWPYQTLVDAIRDGWRVIKFPEQALMLDENRTYGLGLEFILER